MKKTEEYMDILLNNTEHHYFHVTAKELLEKNLYRDKNKKLIYSNSITAIAPVLVNYILWVLKNASEKRIDKLYFLARDGYIMYKIAQVITKQLNINIECVYLYCSRMSLRRPIFFINQNIGLDMIFTHSSKMTISTIYKRLCLTKKDISVFNDLLDTMYNNDTPLTCSQTSSLRRKFENNSKIVDFIHEQSKQSYNNTLGYLMQLGLMDTTSKYAIVDSGWTGSIQKCLKIIIEYSLKSKIEMNGFYFGITNQTEKKYGLYHSYYINSKSPFKRKLYFNNNVFESFCSSNHGMTIGYELRQNKYIPIFNKYKKDENVHIQLNAIINYTILFSKYFKNPFPLPRIDNLVYPILKSIMHNPSYEEAWTYGEIKFCDDYSESYFSSLANTFSIKDNIYTSTIVYIVKKINNKITFDSSQSLWIRGSISKIKSPIRRNILKIDTFFLYSIKYIYELLKPSKKKIK